MAKRQPKIKPTWADVKKKLEGFDRAALVDLVRSLYAAGQKNQAFLHARFGLGQDVLEPYRKTIERWIRPDVFRGDISVSKAKQAISDYRKALGDPEGVAELMVFYCESAAGFCTDITYDDAGYLDALVRMFEQALKTTNTLPAKKRNGHVARLDRVRSISHSFGYGVGDHMDILFSEFRS